MEFAKLYYAMIYRIEQLTGQSDTVLHIHAGMAVLVLARVLTGRSLGTFIPFVFVVAAEVGNEVLDRLADLDEAGRERVRAYEQAHKARKGVLSRLG